MSAEIHRSNTVSWWQSPVAFALGVLVLGMVSAFVGFLMAGEGQNVQDLPTLFNLPPWMFWIVWIIIYPALGVSAWHVWLRRDQQRAQTALGYFGLYLLSNIAFVPLTALFPGLWTAFLLDIVGLVGAIALAWLFRRSAPSSLVWLLPLLVWLPITTLNKVPGILALMQ